MGISDREGANRAKVYLENFGRIPGAYGTFELAGQANRNPPDSRHLIDMACVWIKTILHPAYHELMSMAVGNKLASIALMRANASLILKEVKTMQCFQTCYY